MGYACAIRELELELEATWSRVYILAGNAARTKGMFIGMQTQPSAVAKVASNGAHPKAMMATCDASCTRNSAAVRVLSVLSARRAAVWPQHTWVKAL